jgi:hypothetical protein
VVSQFTTNLTVTLTNGTVITITNVPQPGQVDIAVTKRALITDLALLPGDFIVNGSSYLPGDVVTLIANARNAGDLGISNALVSFYDGDPNTKGILISNVTLTGWLPGRATNGLAVASWLVPSPATNHVLYAVVSQSSATGGTSGAENTQSVNIGGTDLAVSLVSYSAETNGSARVIAQVQNLGAPAATNSTLAIRFNGQAGAPLATAAIPGLEPGQLAQVALDLPPGTQPAGTAVYQLFADETHVVSDVNTNNNVVAFSMVLLYQGQDTNPPVVAIFSPTAGQTFTASLVTVAGTATDAGTPSSGVAVVQVRINGGDWQAASGTTNWSASVNLDLGSDLIEARSQDNAANYSAVASVWVTNVPPDITPPTVAISSPVGGQTVTNSPITITGAATDPGTPSSGVAVVQVRVNGGTWQTATTANGWSDWATTVGLRSGNNLIEARSQDNAGNYSALASVSVTYTSPSPVGASAVFVQENTQTRGNWRQAYGAQGYLIAGEATNAPAGVTVGPITGEYSYSWTNSTLDWRALVKPGVPDDRIAACWASFTSFSIVLDLGSDVSEQVAVYCLDYDKFKGGRAQRVDIVDPASGNTLSSQVVSNFVGGKYLVWNMSGKVRIDITALAANAVVSGLFFGSGTNDAAFVAQDPETQGNWKRAYGAQGYLIVGDSTNCPNYTVGPASGQYFYSWADPTADARALRLPWSPDERIAACWASQTNFSIDVNVGTNAPVRLAVYCLDWDVWQGGRVEQVTMLDQANGETLSSQVISNFTEGNYVVWEIIGQVQLNVNSVATNANAVLSGIFFGTGRSSARFVGQDLSTQGSWEGTYGAEGYVIASDATNCPGYTVGPFNGQYSWSWADQTNDVRALQRPDLPGERIAACWASGTNFTIDLDTGLKPDAQVALYCLDFDQWQGGRAQRVDITDPGSSRSSVGEFCLGK